MSSTATDDLARLQRQIAAQQHLLEKLKQVRSLYVTTHSSTLPIEKTAVEFFYIVGDILQGCKAEDLDLRTISRPDFLRELSDG